jgi:hypothetical protein
MMEAERTSETSVDIQFRTRQYIPEDSELHTRRREILKSQKLMKTRIRFTLSGRIGYFCFLVLLNFIVCLDVKQKHNLEAAIYTSVAYLCI